MTGNGQPALLDTLAAAYAEVGDFNRAIEMARSAIEIAKQADKPALARQIESHLRLLERGEPIREPATHDQDGNQISSGRTSIHSTT